MQKITYEGFEALCLALIRDDADVLYISLAGATVPTKAIAAALVSKDTRKSDSGIHVGGSSVHLGRFEHYRMLSSRARERKGHGITTRITILHSRFTVQETEARTLYFVQPPDADVDQPPPGFFDRLQMASKVPMFREWESWLWREGQKKIRWVYKYPSRDDYVWSSSQMVAPMVVQLGRLRCWKVSTRDRAWIAVLRRHFGLEVELLKSKVDETFFHPSGWLLHWSEKSGCWQIWKDGKVQVRDGAGKLLGVSLEELGDAYTTLGGGTLDAAIQVAEYECGVRLRIPEGENA